MPVPNSEPAWPRYDVDCFATTHWSVVLRAGETESPRACEALEELCRTYWYAIYVFVRRQGKNPEDAQDLTQSFLARLLEKGYFAKADPDRGKFRTFLLGSLNNFLVNEWKRAGRIKRGGDATFLSFDGSAAEDRYVVEQIETSTPAAAYDRQWAVALVEQVFSTLRDEYTAAGKAEVFAALKVFIWGDSTTASYAEIGQRLSLAEGAIKVAVHRLRQRFRTALRAKVAHTVSAPENIDDELRYLIAALT
jgi:RNA polymerase sigma-70 factor (ECF subfamily)